MCSKNLDEQYTADIVFFGTALFFNLMSLADALHLFYLVWCIRPKCPKQFLLPLIIIENVCRLLRKSMLPTMIIKMCAK